MTDDAKALHEDVRELAREDLQALAKILRKVGHGQCPPAAFFERLAKTAGAIQYSLRKSADAGLGDAILQESNGWLSQASQLWASGVARTQAALDTEHFAPLAALPAPPRTAAKLAAWLDRLAMLRSELDHAQDEVRTAAGRLDDCIANSHLAKAFTEPVTRLRAELAIQADGIRQRLRNELSRQLEQLGQRTLAEVTAAHERQAYALLEHGAPVTRADLALALLLGDLEVIEHATARAAKLALAAGLPNVPGLDSLERAKGILRDGLAAYRAWCAELQQQHTAFGLGPDPFALIRALGRGALSGTSIAGAFGLDSRHGPYWFVFPFEEACRRNGLVFQPPAPPTQLAGVRLIDLQRPSGPARLPLDACRLLFIGLRQETACGECGAEIPWPQLHEAATAPRRAPLETAVRELLKDRPCCQERALRQARCSHCGRTILPQTRMAYRGRIAAGTPPSEALPEALAGLQPCCGTALVAFDDLRREAEHPAFPPHQRQAALALLAAAIIETRLHDPHPRNSRPFASGETPFPGLAACLRPEVYIVPAAVHGVPPPLFRLGAWSELQRLPGLAERAERGRNQFDATLKPIQRALLGQKAI
jgi:hypothetical protein